MNRLVITASVLAVLLCAGECCRAMNIDSLKVSLISGDYKAAIKEGEKLLSSSKHDDPGLPELYYVLGLSYLKQGNLLRSSDIFDIIRTEFADSEFAPDAAIGLGDVCFLKEDYERAKGYYSGVMAKQPQTKLKPIIYHRLSQCALKQGNAPLAQEYSNKLQQEFPNNLEMRSTLFQQVVPEIVYTIQVGSFSNKANATRLVDSLSARGYQAYIEEGVSCGKPLYRVKVGKMTERQQAVALANKLVKEGHPTKIIP